MLNVPKRRQTNDAPKDDKIGINDIFAMFRDDDVLTLSCRDVMAVYKTKTDDSDVFDPCKQNAFSSKCVNACTLAPSDLYWKLATSKDENPTNGQPIVAPTVVPTNQPTINNGNASFSMKQYLGNRDYEIDFQHRSALNATVTQLGTTSGECEDACISDSSCAIATYYDDENPNLTRCVYKTTLVDGIKTTTKTLNDDVYADFRPKAVSFEKVQGKTADEAGRRSSEISRLLKEAVDQQTKREFDGQWLTKPNVSFSDVLYEWKSDIRAVTDPTDAHIMACAKHCDDTQRCTSFVIRHATSEPKNGDAVCGLISQPYQQESAVFTPNVSTYERNVL
jgi:hypothetical protein